FLNLALKYVRTSEPTPASFARRAASRAVLCFLAKAFASSLEEKVESKTRRSQRAKNLVRVFDGLVSPEYPTFLPGLGGSVTSRGLTVRPFRVTFLPCCSLAQSLPSGIPNAFALSGWKAPGLS